MDALTDASLLEAWRAGDLSAGRALFERHFEAVARFFSSKFPQECDDLVQSTFLACAEAPGNFEGRSSFRSYLLGIANHVLLRQLRRHCARRPNIDLDDVSLHDLGTSLSAKLARKSEHAKLLEALRRLPVHEQVALELYYWEDLPASEIATVLETPEGTIRTRIRSAKGRLARLLVEVPAKLQGD